jgi:hypothetical protein
MAEHHAPTAPPADADSGNGRGGGLSAAARRLLGIIAYYAAATLTVALLWRSFPVVGQLIASDGLTELAGANPFGPSDVAATVREEAASSGVSTSTLTLFALVGALATALPVAWVYSLTRRKKGFEQSMVHTLILLPMAIAGMVVLIQNSLALAFSLAGIVGLLRFRNTLDDTKDGVYIFVAASIGISAAVGALVVGVLTSVLFNVVVLTLWWIDFARTPTPGIRGGIRRLARLPKLAPPAPAPAPTRVRAGNGVTMRDEVFATAAQAWRRQLIATAEHTAVRQGRYNATLKVHTLDCIATQPLVERLLGEHAKRWELAGVTPGEGGRTTLRYLVRIRHHTRSDLLHAVRERGMPQVVGVEFR